MRKVDFLKNTLKCGVLSSNLLNCNAMENGNSIKNENTIHGKRALNDIKWKYVLQNVTNFTGLRKVLRIVQNNKAIQKRLDFTIETYKEVSIYNKCKDFHFLIFPALEKVCKEDLTKNGLKFLSNGYMNGEYVSYIKIEMPKFMESSVSGVKYFTDFFEPLHIFDEHKCKRIVVNLDNLNMKDYKKIIMYEDYDFKEHIKKNMFKDSHLTIGIDKYRLPIKGLEEIIVKNEENNYDIEYDNISFPNVNYIYNDINNEFIKFIKDYK